MALCACVCVVVVVGGGLEWIVDHGRCLEEVGGTMGVCFLRRYWQGCCFFFSSIGGGGLLHSYGNRGATIASVGMEPTLVED